MKYSLITFAIISSLLSLCSGAAIESNPEPEKLSTGWGTPFGWGSVSNGTTVSAGQTVVAEDVASATSSSDNVNVTAYSTEGGTFTVNSTMNNTAYNDFYTDTIVAETDTGFVYNDGNDFYQDAITLSQTAAGANNIGSVNFTQKPVNTVAFSADAVGVSSWVTGSEGINVSPVGGSGYSGWKQDQ